MMGRLRDRMPDNQFDDLWDGTEPEIEPITKEIHAELDEMERVLLDTPRVRVSVDKGKELWIVDNGRLSKQYIPGNELKDYTYTEGDNDPASPEQAYA